MKTPPAEWPIRIGGESSAFTIDSRWSMIAGTVTCSIGVGSAFSASTSTSKPGYAGARTRWPRPSNLATQCSHDRGVTQNPWIRTMVSAAAGSELTAWSLLNRVEIRNSRAQVR